MFTLDHLVNFNNLDMSLGIMNVKHMLNNVTSVTWLNKNAR